MSRITGKRCKETTQPHWNQGEKCKVTLARVRVVPTLTRPHPNIGKSRPQAPFASRRGKTSATSNRGLGVPYPDPRFGHNQSKAFSVVFWLASTRGGNPDPRHAVRRPQRQPLTTVPTSCEPPVPMRRRPHAVPSPESLGSFNRCVFFHSPQRASTISSWQSSISSEW